MLELAFNRLKQSLISISGRSTLAEAPRYVVTAAFSDAWTIIDSANRFRALLRLFPESRDIVEIQTFLDDTEPIKLLRDRVQHLQARFDKLVSQKQPTWGWITWITFETLESVQSHALVAGSLKGLKGLRAENPAGKLITPPIDLITLNAHGLSVALVNVINQVANLVALIEESLTPQFEEYDRTGADLYLVMTMESPAQS